MRLSKTSRCLVGIIYRKSTANTKYDYRMLEKLLRSNQLGNIQVIVSGDFNLYKVNCIGYTYNRGDDYADAQSLNSLKNFN